MHLTLDVNGDGDVTDADEIRFTYTRDEFGRIKSEEMSNTAYMFQPLTAEATVDYLSTPIGYTGDDNQGYSNNQYTSVGGNTQAYDARGNLTNDGTFTYTWSKENQLTKVTQLIDSVEVIVSEYAYDAVGRRVQKEVTLGSLTTRYLWGGGTNYAEYSGGDILQRVYVYGPGIDEPLMVREYDAQAKVFDPPQYVHRDGKNTVIAISGGAVGTASVTNIFTMDAWGDGTDAAISPYKFTSRRLDDETGNYYYRNRYYHAKQGRFMSNDPIGYGDGLNMYAYVGNDPVNFSDPMGLDTEEITVTAPRINNTCPEGAICIGGQSLRDIAGMTVVMYGPNAGVYNGYGANPDGAGGGGGNGGSQTTGNDSGNSSNDIIEEIIVHGYRTGKVDDRLAKLLRYANAVYLSTSAAYGHEQGLARAKLIFGHGCDNIVRDATTSYQGTTLNLTYFLGGQVTTGRYQSTTGETGDFLTVHGTAGLQASGDVAVGRIPGSPTRGLGGWSASANLSKGYVTGTVTLNSNADFGGDLGLGLGIGGSGSGGYTWLTPDEGTRNMCELE